MFSAWGKLIDVLVPMCLGPSSDGSLSAHLPHIAVLQERGSCPIGSDGSWFPTVPITSILGKPLVVFAPQPMKYLASSLLGTALVGLLGCSSDPTSPPAPGGTGATLASGGLPGTGSTGAIGGLASGGLLGTGSVTPSTGGAVTTGGVPTGGSGATAGTGGGGALPSTGGMGAVPGTGGGAAVPNTGGIGGGTGATGGDTTGGSGAAPTTGGVGTGGAVGPGAYALPPPSQCHNQDYVDFQEGCIDGDTTSVCGGKCSVINGCQEDSTMKPYADTAFICPRFMLFSPEMLQAATDDGLADFNYAVVGHDVDRGGIDGQDDSTCCQCYQLVFAHPSPNNDRQVLTNPDNPNPPVSAIPLPKPLIVQSFNTAATPYSFDVYMAAGGFGANNSCGPGQQPVSRSGLYLYTDYPPDGQPSQGGVKPVTHYSECKTEIQWVTTESLSSDACQSRVADACNQLTSEIPGLTEQARTSCIRANSPDSYYHLNWSVYAKKVECPEHLTQVTGCQLAPQGLPAVNASVTTADQAAADPSFLGQSSLGEMYETTTMEDCCRPSCASKDWVEGRGLVADSEYNAFYSCDVNGLPYLEE